MTIAKKVEEFKKKFVKESVFGVAIGAIDNFSGTGEEQVLKWLEASLREVEEEAKKEIPDDIEPLYMPGGDPRAVRKNPISGITSQMIGDEDELLEPEYESQPLTEGEGEKKPEEKVYYPESVWELFNTNCCGECHDVTFEKTYPAHTPYYACINLNCDCHKPQQESKEKCPNCEGSGIACVPPKDWIGDYELSICHHSGNTGQLPSERIKELKTPDWLKVLNKEQFKQCLIYDLKVLQFPYRGTEAAEKIKKIIEFVEEWE